MSGHSSDWSLPAFSRSLESNSPRLVTAEGMGAAVHSPTFVNFCGLWSNTHKSASVSRVPSPGTSPRGAGWCSAVLKWLSFTGKTFQGDYKTRHLWETLLTWRTHSGIVLSSLLQSLGLLLPLDNIFHGICGAAFGWYQMQGSLSLGWVVSAVIKESKQVGKGTFANSNVLWDFLTQWSQRCPILCVEKRSKTSIMMINIFRRILISRYERGIELNPGQPE